MNISFGSELPNVLDTVETVLKDASVSAVVHVTSTGIPSP